MWSVYVILFTLVSISNAENNEKPDKMQDKFIEIYKKVKKISLDSMKGLSNEHKQDTLKTIEDKLMKAAEPLGEKGKKYVDLIMRGIRLNSQYESNISRDASHTNKSHISNLNDKKLKQRVVEHIASKVEKLTKKYNADKNISDNNMIKEIRAVILKSVNKESESILKKSLKIKKISDMVIDELNHLTNKSLKNSRRLNTGHRTDKNAIDDDITELVTTTAVDTKNLLPAQCTTLAQSVCYDIKKMNIFKCRYADLDIYFYKLCDGVVDCPDRSDEMQCPEQAVDKVRYTRSVMNAVNNFLENNCLKNVNNENVLSKQSYILRDILEAQLDFVEKYTHANISNIETGKNNKDIKNEKDTSKYTVKEITDIVSTLSISLNKVLCSEQTDLEDISPSGRRIDDIFDDSLDKPILDEFNIWPPKKCLCEKDLCMNCSYFCKRICWQKYSLQHFNCYSINDTSGVSLNTLCDGKYDCYDETDEKSCTLDSAIGKFEAHKIFSYITKSLHLKAKKDYSMIKKPIIFLLNIIFNLEKLSTKPNPNPRAIKNYRRDYFSTLSTMFIELIRHTSFPYEMEHNYLYLLSLNQQMVSILKYIGTGNKKILSETCLCQKGLCVIAGCNKRCQKICSVKSNFTLYNCNASDKVIHIHEICDKKYDCPLKDDEVDCLKDVCRGHHLTLLRNKILEVGKKQEGTAVGELLSTWKTKVIPAIKLGENEGRPTVKKIKNLVKEICHDLLLTYGSVQDYRKSHSNYALNDFVSIVQSLIRSVRSCGQ